MDDAGKIEGIEDFLVAVRGGNKVALRRLADVYRATIGAKTAWGVLERRDAAVRLARLLYPAVRATAAGTARAAAGSMLLLGLATECEEPAFRSLRWGVDLDSIVTGRRVEAVRFLAFLAVRCGALGARPDPKAHVNDSTVTAMANDLAKSNPAARAARNRRKKIARTRRKKKPAKRAA